MSPSRARSARYWLAVVLLGPVGSLSLPAQRPAHFEHRDADLVHAKELFDKEQYTAARQELEQVVARIRDAHDPSRVEAEFLTALCAVRLFNDDAAYRLLAFIDAHPEDVHVATVRLELFRYYFSRKRWEDCLAWAAQVDEPGLNTEDREEYHFKKGYALFQQDLKDQALAEFDKVKDGTGIYAAPATYYAAHIAYERGNYTTALSGFEKLRDDPNFGRVVPFYIAEILFLQGKYDELKEVVGPLLDETRGARRIHEINRLVGEAHYRSGEYAEALPYLQKSAQRIGGVERNDRYMLGYAHYRSGGYKEAIDQFNLVANEDDSLGQVATYHMADAYLKLNEKNYARNAFKRAYAMGIDPKVTEDALFNYAKLSYELSFDPYHEAIMALRNYLKEYPDSPRHDEAYEFLLNVYLKTRNYEDALEALDQVRNKDLRLQEAYQKLAFDRGVELYEGRKYADAALFFERALKYPVNKEVNARSHYWKGESLYAQGEYQAAMRAYDALRNSPGAYSTELYELAGYSQGYCYFKQKQYSEATTSFRRFVGTGRGEARQRSDAMLRIGDAYFVMKDEAQAIKWYDDAIRAGSPDSDYAMYQKGVCLGLERRFDEKLAVLRELLNKDPNSRYAADARYQLGETYLNLEKDAEALTYYRQVLEQHPNSPHVRQSMLQTALIHKRQGDPEKALDEFKAIVAKYPTMDGARDALAGIEAIYVEQGRVGEYETYVSGLSFVDASSLDLDEKYYRSAEQLYFDEQCDKAIGAFGDYLAKYPNGAYALNALFYRGDCAYRTGKYDLALPDLEAVVQRDAPQFLESALYGASDILFRDGRWEGALDHFLRLEEVANVPRNKLAAQVGALRCMQELGRVEGAAEVAQRVLDNPDATDDLRAEAGLAVAKGHLAKEELDVAYTRFRQVATSSRNALGAEAKYHMMYVRYLQARYRDAEQEVFELVNDFPAYDHWKARAFILLGDVYVQLDDRFQAKATLQSVIDNSTEAELVAQARARLDAILASELEETTPAPEEELEVPLGEEGDPQDSEE